MLQKLIVEMIYACIPSTFQFNSVTVYAFLDGKEESLVLDIAIPTGEKLYFIRCIIFPIYSVLICNHGSSKPYKNYSVMTDEPHVCEQWL